MIYMGSKRRIASQIAPIILEGRTTEQYYVEPFVGGANMLECVGGLRIASDFNQYLAAMWQALECGWLPKTYYTKEEYYDIKANPDRDKAETGWVAISASWRCKWWGGVLWRRK